MASKRSKTVNIGISRNTEFKIVNETSILAISQPKYPLNADLISGSGFCLSQTVGNVISLEFSKFKRSKPYN